MDQSELEKNKSAPYPHNFVVEPSKSAVAYNVLTKYSDKMVKPDKQTVGIN